MYDHIFFLPDPECPVRCLIFYCRIPPAVKMNDMVCFRQAKWQEQIHRWEKENPLAMRRDRGISPQMIMEHINAQFPHSIYVTDVGQHQMWATQYLELHRL